MSVTMSPTPANVPITPAPTKSTLSTNYITSFDFLSQYLPDVYEKEFERYGNRSIASFLRLVGAEIPSNSDLIKWTEQGRLHTIVKSATRSGEVITSNSHPFRLQQTVIISDGTNSAKALITAVNANGNAFTVSAYGAANLTAAGMTGTTGLTIFVYGSEFKKGTNGMEGSLEANPVIFENNPIIIKDKYEVAGSDLAQVGWIEVTTENGATGYLWYLKSEHETRLRFEDYLETAMVEGEPAASGSAAATAGYNGKKGLFHEVENRGNVATGSIAAKTDVEAIVKVLDKQGAIQENVIFSARDKSFEIDNMLAAQNNFGSSGASFGLFDNDKDMALNLGFSGFNIGYDFYKTDWKYLNDATTRGAIGDIDGIVVPAGTTTVYDQVLGKNAKRPFLHVRFRKSEAEDRKYKTWVVGSAGGAGMSSDLDAMQVHFLSDRALCVMGANNFVIMK